MKFYYETLLKGDEGQKSYHRRRRLHMLSDLACSAMYLEVKRTAED